MPEWYPSDASPVIGVFVEEQAVVLAKHLDVTVLVPELLRWRHRLRPAPAVAIEQRRGINVVRVRTWPVAPRWKRAGYAAYLRAAERAFRIAVERFGVPDVLHAHVVRHAGWAAAIIGRREGIPVVLTEHSGPFSMHLAHPLDRARVAATLRDVDAVIAVSPTLSAAIDEFVPVSPMVIGNVVDTTFFAPSPSQTVRDGSEPFRVLSVALLTPSKRMDLVIDAVAMLAKKTSRSVELTIIGEGPERANLERRAAAAGLRERCRFLGSADRMVVVRAMQQCDAYVLASDAETFGIVVAEAMACARPVIATRAGGPEYIVERATGVLVPVGSAAAIAEALVALEAGTLVVDVAAARQSIVNRFGPDAFLDAIVRVYERVARPGATRAGA